jgi:hypothetical protein
MLGSVGTPDVEAGGLVVDRRVPVRAGEQEQDPAPGRDHHAVDDDVLMGVPARVLHRRVEPKDLFDRVRGQPGVRTEEVPLIAMVQ